MKRIITNLLLAFVVFSIGFAVGKEFTIKSSSSYQQPAAEKDEAVIIYYLRSTFRCWQCNMIEVYADELLNTEFSEQLTSGTVQWQVIDYLQNRELAARYNISGNTIIVSRYVDGEEVDYERLDRVMEKVFNYEEFMSYLRNAIYLQTDDNSV